MIRLLLVDYGEVISTPLPESTITDLAALADQPRAAFLDRYWHHRPAYDLGQPATEYWSRVLDRDMSGSPRIVAQLTSTDVYGWLRAPPWPPHQPADGPGSSAARPSSAGCPPGRRSPPRWACCPC